MTDVYVKTAHTRLASCQGFVRHLQYIVFCASPSSVPLTEAPAGPSGNSDRGNARDR